jgi:hypothetical protein
MSDIRSSLDHLIGGVQEFVRDAEAERLGGPSDETRARAEIPGPSCASCSPKTAQLAAYAVFPVSSPSVASPGIVALQLRHCLQCARPPLSPGNTLFRGRTKRQFPRTKLKGWRKNFSIYLPSSAIRERFGLLVGKIGV